MQRLHREPERVQEPGPTASYDYGAMRETWLCNPLTGWIGDDGWRWRQQGEMVQWEMARIGRESGE